MRARSRGSIACVLLLIGCSTGDSSRPDSWTAGAKGGDAQPAGHAPSAHDAGDGGAHRNSDAGGVPTSHVGTGLEPDQPATRDGGDGDGGARRRRGVPSELVVCDPAPSMEDLSFAIEWQWSDAEGTEPGLPLVANVTDDNGDGVIDTSDTPDVIMQEPIGNTLVVIDGATGKEHARIAGVAPYGTDPAVGDVDADGQPRSSASTTCTWSLTTAMAASCGARRCRPTSSAPPRPRWPISIRTACRRS